MCEDEVDRGSFIPHSRYRGVGVEKTVWGCREVYKADVGGQVFMRYSPADLRKDIDRVFESMLEG